MAVVRNKKHRGGTKSSGLLLFWDAQCENRFTGQKYQSPVVSITALCSCDMAGRRERTETHVGIGAN